MRVFPDFCPYINERLFQSDFIREGGDSTIRLGNCLNGKDK